MIEMENIIQNELSSTLVCGAGPFGIYITEDIACFEEQFWIAVPLSEISSLLDYSKAGDYDKFLQIGVDLFVEPIENGFILQNQNHLEVVISADDITLLEDWLERDD